MMGIGKLESTLVSFAVTVFGGRSFRLNMRGEVLDSFGRALLLLRLFRGPGLPSGALVGAPVGREGGWVGKGGRDNALTANARSDLKQFVKCIKDPTTGK